MAESNFLLFDQNKANMLTSEEYASNSARLNGVQSGVASSQLHNKFSYQTSLMFYALAQLMVQNGNDASDEAAVSAFVSNLSNTLLQKEVDKATLQEALAGTSNTKWLTPYTGKQMVDEFATTAIVTCIAPVGSTVTMTHNSSGKAWSAIADNDGAAIVYPSRLGEYTVSCSGFTSKSFTLQNIGITFGVAFVSGTFASHSWADIARYSAMGVASNLYNVGDEKTISIGGTAYTLQIADFDHDDLADGTGKAGITLVMKSCLATTYQMNSSNTNAGGWTSCAMRSTHIPNIIANFPTDLKNVVKPVAKKSSAGSQSSNIVTTTDSFWLFAEVELFGTTAHSVAGEGSQYPIFTDNASRIKTLGPSGSAQWWWERSPRVSDSSSFCSVSADGAASLGNANGSAGVVLGFCV